jgi:hypothetical protein
MRLASWIKPKPAQLELLCADVGSNAAAPAPDTQKSATPPSLHGNPLLLPLAALCEDPNDPRTDVPETELDELAEDIRQHGILQPIVVHPVDAQGRCLIHFGAKRWRAAQRAGLIEVPVVVRDALTDPYTQVEQRQLARPMLLLQPHAQSPDVLRLERRLLPDELALVPGLAMMRARRGVCVQEGGAIAPQLRTARAGSTCPAKLQTYIHFSIVMP